MCIRTNLRDGERPVKISEIGICQPTVNASVRHTDASLPASVDVTDAAGRPEKCFKTSLPTSRTARQCAVTFASPDTTLLRKLSLLFNGRSRRTLYFMRFRETWQLFDGCPKNKESASRANDSTLCQGFCLPVGLEFRRRVICGAVVNGTKRAFCMRTDFEVPFR